MRNWHFTHLETKTFVFTKTKLPFTVDWLRHILLWHDVLAIAWRHFILTGAGPATHQSVYMYTSTRTCIYGTRWQRVWQTKPSTVTNLIYVDLMHGFIPYMSSACLTWQANHCETDLCVIVTPIAQILSLTPDGSHPCLSLWLDPLSSGFHSSPGR